MPGTQIRHPRVAEVPLPAWRQSGVSTAMGFLLPTEQRGRLTTSTHVRYATFATVDLHEA